MINQLEERKKELSKMRRVADMMCSAHARIRDRYAQLALCLDIVVLALSTWLVALAFVEPQINIKLTPFGIDAKIWMGLLASATFFLTLIQQRADWKGKANAHKYSLKVYARIKIECRQLLNCSETIDIGQYNRLIEQYAMAGDIGIEIPENEFILQKKYHLRKVAISRHLDQFPSTSILLLKIKWFFIDNITCRRK